MERKEPHSFDLDLLLTVAQVAAMLGYSKARIYELLAQRRLPHVKLGSSGQSAVRFKRSAILALIDACEVPAQTEPKRRPAPTVQPTVKPGKRRKPARAQAKATVDPMLTGREPGGRVN